MSVYRDGAPGITTRGPGEPCQHPAVARISYSDAYGLYTRCQVCSRIGVAGQPLGAGTAAAAGSDPLVLDHQIEAGPPSSDARHN